MTDARYTFYSWIREGVVREISEPDSAAPGGVLRVGVDLGLDVKGNVSGAPRTIEVNTLMQGPGEVVALNPRQVVRTEPPSGSTDFEPNYLACIEFDRPDLPWMLTPRAAGNRSRLRPWICLVAVPRDQVPPLNRGAGPLPFIEVDADELPDLAQCHYWAHGQIAGSVPTSTDLDDFFRDEPSRTVSRLLCPRKLEPRTAYRAFVVPTFKAGVDAGLGLATAGDSLDYAWLPGDGLVTLPFYFTWEFSTGAGGDFELLARLIKPHVPENEIGLVTMDVSNPGGGIAMRGLPAVVMMEGALTSPSHATHAWTGLAASDFDAAMRVKFDAMSARASTTVGPPLYGQWHANVRSIPNGANAIPWLNQLNLDPRFRAAAGLGARVVKANQESIMAAAWEQLPGLTEVNQVLRQTQLAREVLGRVRTQRIASLAPVTLVQVIVSAFARLQATGTTIQGMIRRSHLPESLVGTAFRKTCRARGPIGRRSGPELALRERGLLARAAVTAVEPGPASVPSGMVTFDAVALEIEPGAADFRFDALRAERFLRRDAPGTRVPAPRTVTWQPRGGGDALAAPRASRDDAGRVRPGPTAGVGRVERGVVARSALELALEATPVAAPVGRSASTSMDRSSARRLRRAVISHQAMLRIGVPGPARRAVADFDFDGIRSIILAGVYPEQTVQRRLLSRLQLDPSIHRSPSGDPIDPVMAAPVFPTPMYERLLDLRPDALLPGIGKIPRNSSVLLRSNTAFIAAFLAGANTEIGSELLWRGFPTDQRGTYVRRFWDRIAADGREVDDVPPMHTWSRTQNLFTSGAAPTGDLVLLLRADLIRRYPNVIVLAVPARWGNEHESASGHVHGKRIRRPDDADPARILHPTFDGNLGGDMFFFGFALGLEEARGDDDVAAGKPGWFFVVAEQPSEPRFGLDVMPEGWSGASKSLGLSTDDLHWGHLASDVAAFDTMRCIELPSEIPVDTPVATSDGRQVSWARNAAHVARGLLQRPVRIAFHASALLAD